MCVNCAWTGCNRPIHSRGYCGSHYNKARASGLLPSRPFWVEDTNTGCWLWNRKRRKDGYGRKSIDHSREIPAHRWVYEQHVGPIPDGLEIDHLCNNPPCVNPGHLEPVTHVENMLRQWRRRRAA
uniref:HNH endonuclease n=2 Tax=unclassified Mycobacterium TaxID=2642494 RepID=A0A5Q5BL12_MYCSS